MLQVTDHLPLSQTRVPVMPDFDFNGEPFELPQLFKDMPDLAPVKVEIYTSEAAEHLQGL